MPKLKIGVALMRIYLVRHGLTHWNHEFRYQGHTDIELSPQGIEQAFALKKRLKGEDIKAIFSSDLRRARQTAEIINQEHNLEIQIDPALKEVNFGVWEGLTYQDLQQKYPEQLKIWKDTPHLLDIETGETFDSLMHRAINFVNNIYNAYRKDNIIVVSHGGTIAAMICGLMNEPLKFMWTYKQKNAALNIIKRNNTKVVIELLNDTSHLELV